MTCCDAVKSTWRIRGVSLWRMSQTAAYSAVDYQEFGLGLSWQKSSFCGASSANCVEAAVLERHTFVRDTKGPAVRMLGFSRARWSEFVEGLHRQP
jgi:hypothetical protein